MLIETVFSSFAILTVYNRHCYYDSIHPGQPQMHGSHGIIWSILQYVALSMWYGNVIKALYPSSIIK